LDLDEDGRAGLLQPNFTPGMQQQNSAQYSGICHTAKSVDEVHSSVPSDPRISALIEKALAAGVSEPSLVGILSARGWPEKEIYSALAEYYERKTGVEIPRRAASGASAKDAFFYLLIFSTLGTWTFAAGSLAFTLIDRWLPDPLFAGYPATDNFVITSSMAAILVAFPLFLLVSRAVATEAARQPEKLESAVRKWLTYLALVIAACVMMGDLIAALSFLLRGELTSRFLAKAFVVLVLSGGVFAFYFAGLRRTDEVAVAARRNRLAAAASSAVVVLMVALGFWQMGAPSNQRQMRADEQRLRDLYELSNQIDNYWTAHNSQLPSGVDQLPGRRFADPVTHAAYTYVRADGNNYRLCATFAQSSPSNGQAATAAGVDEWSHSAGYHCFELLAAVRMPFPLQYNAY
jgi:hypothetical protein